MGSDRVSRIAAALAVTAVLVATLLPGVPRAEDPLGEAAWSPALSDWLRNLLLFAPLGAALSGRGWTAARSLALGAALSVAIELAQLALPGRLASAMDVVCNTAGTGLGAALFRTRAAWSAPTERAARALTLAAGAAAAAVLAATPVLLAPAPHAARYFGHLDPEMGSLAPYAGTVREAWIGDLPLPHGPVRDTARIRRLLTGDTTVRIAGVAGPPPARLAAFVLVAGEAEEEILLVGPDGDDLVYRYRSRSRRVGLDDPRRRLPDALAGLAPGRPFALRLERRGGDLCVGRGEASAPRCGHGFTVGDGWLVVTPAWALLESRPGLCRAAWIAALFVPLGFWARADAAGAAALCAAGAALLLAGTAATLLPTPGSHGVAAAVGLGVGRLLRHRPGRATATLAPGLRRPPRAPGGPRSGRGGEQLRDRGGDEVRSERGAPARSALNARGALRRLRAEAFRWTGRSERARRRLDGSCAAVLLYHRVLPRRVSERDAVEPGMYVSPESFARHLEWLAADFRVLPLHEILGRLAAGRPLPPGACALTFDDGWRDNAEYALPELERRGIPATIFVVTRRVGTEGAFWPDEVCRRLASVPAPRRRELAVALGAAPGGDPVAGLLDVLKAVPEVERGPRLEALREATPCGPQPGRELCDWGELERLASAGVDVESHGATHAILTGLPDEEVERELRASRETLRERGHGRHDLLAYPSGAHDARVAAIARRVGYRAAVTTDPGLLRAAGDPLALPRLSLHEDVSASRAEFLFRVPGTA